MVLTESGLHVLRYAEEIFSLGQDLVASVEANIVDRPLRLTVGVADVLPKRVAHALILPAFHLPKKIRIVCREDSPERLLAELAVQEVDVVLSGAPVPPSVSVRAQSHLLGKTGVCLMASPRIAPSLRAGFPESMTGAPLLVPTERAAVRRELDRWFDEHNVHAMVVGEFDDFALMGVFAQAGDGAFPVPEVIADEAALEFGVERVATLDGLTGNFYAICLERNIEREAVSAILSGAAFQPSP